MSIESTPDIETARIEYQFNNAACLERCPFCLSKFDTFLGISPFLVGDPGVIVCDKCVTLVSPDRITPARPVDMDAEHFLSTGTHLPGFQSASDEADDDPSAALDDLTL